MNIRQNILRSRLLFRTKLHIFALKYSIRNVATMREIQYIACTAVLLASMLGIGCQRERAHTASTPCHISFAEQSYIFGVVDSKEWFEIPITATGSANADLYFGVEIVASQSSAIQDLHYTLESTTLHIPEGKSSASLRIKCNPENIAIGQDCVLTVRLVLDEENIGQGATECSVMLRHCCPFNLRHFEGYAVLTSTWCMQYMNCNSRLVHTQVDYGSNIVVIEDMLYEGYDIEVELDNSDRLNPTAKLCGTQVLASTGEAFGTIYGDGKLLIAEASEYESSTTDLSGYVSFYSPCERFMMLYTVMYVEGVGEVGMFGNIVEWISKDEAERIMREGLD